MQAQQSDYCVALRGATIGAQAPLPRLRGAVLEAQAPVA